MNWQNVLKLAEFDTPTDCRCPVLLGALRPDGDVLPDDALVANRRSWMNDDTALMTDDDPPSDVRRVRQLDSVVIPNVAVHREVQAPQDVLDWAPDDTLARLSLDPRAESMGGNGPEPGLGPVQVMRLPVFPDLQNQSLKLTWNDGDEQPAGPAIRHVGFQWKRVVHVDRTSRKQIVIHHAFGC